MAIIPIDEQHFKIIFSLLLGQEHDFVSKIYYELYCATCKNDEAEAKKIIDKLNLSVIMRNSNRQN